MLAKRFSRILLLTALALLMSLVSLTLSDNNTAQAGNGEKKKEDNPNRILAVGCWGTGCNGKDPVVTGCINGAYPVFSPTTMDFYPETAPIFIQPNATVAVQVWWSPTCKTNWARAYISRSDPSNYSFPMKIELRKNNNAIIQGTEWSLYGRALYGDMYYAPSEQVRACGKIDWNGYQDVLNCTNLA